MLKERLVDWLVPNFLLQRLRFRPSILCGICVGHRGTEAGFLLVLRFSLPVTIDNKTKLTNLFKHVDSKSRQKMSVVSPLWPLSFVTKTRRSFIYVFLEVSVILVNVNLFSFKRNRSYKYILCMFLCLLLIKQMITLKLQVSSIFICKF